MSDKVSLSQARSVLADGLPPAGVQSAGEWLIEIADLSEDWVVVALEWLAAAAKVPPGVIRGETIRNLTEKLSMKLAELRKHENADRAYRLDAWALWAATNAALCIDAPGQDVLRDQEIADDIATAASALSHRWLAMRNHTGKKSKSVPNAPAWGRIIELALSRQPRGARSTRSFCLPRLIPRNYWRKSCGPPPPALQWGHVLK